MSGRRAAAPDLGRRRLYQLHDDRGPGPGQAAYRGNYDRLAQVKRRYGPDNVFHINQNIQPATGPNP